MYTITFINKDKSKRSISMEVDAEKALKILNESLIRRGDVTAHLDISNFVGLLSTTASISYIDTFGVFKPAEIFTPLMVKNSLRNHSV